MCGNCRRPLGICPLRWGAVTEHYAHVSALGQGRTDQQCMGRWRRHLDPNINRAPWTPAEDASLGGLVGRHGSQWSRIARSFDGRTAQQCRARCGSLASPPPECQ